MTAHPQHSRPGRHAPWTSAQQARLDAARLARRPHHGRTFLITGAASGIGAAIARRVHDTTGAHIIAVDLDHQKNALVELAETSGPDRITVAVADVGHADQIAELPARVDVLVNAAGFLRLAPLDAYPDGLFERILDVMVTGPAMLARHVIPHMRTAGYGRIVNISSTMGARAQRNKAAYCAAKGGLEQLSRVIAQENGAFGITSNTVRLSHVDTPLAQQQMLDESALHGLPVAAYMDRVMLHPLIVKRLLPADAVAAFVEQLWGPVSGYITAAALTMDCGWTGADQ